MLLNCTTKIYEMKIITGSLYLSVFKYLRDKIITLFTLSPELFYALKAFAVFKFK